MKSNMTWNSMQSPSQRTAGNRNVRYTTAMARELRASGNLSRRIERCTALSASMVSMPMLGLVVQASRSFVEDMKGRTWLKRSR
jgi:hypothetical protein